MGALDVDGSATVGGAATGEGGGDGAGDRGAEEAGVREDTATPGRGAAGGEALAAGAAMANAAKGMSNIVAARFGSAAPSSPRCNRAREEFARGRQAAMVRSPMTTQRSDVATRPGPTCEARIVAFEDDRETARFDRLATEEPLEIRLRAGAASRTVAITMRTPGNDFELAAGFLHNEGVLAGNAALRRISYCLAGEVDADQQYNIVNVELSDAVLPDLDALERHFTMTSACGICGKASLAALRGRGFAPLDDEQRVTPQAILALPALLRERQGVFAKTGGLHAAALFDAHGSCLATREDVGRHNAVDKLVGWALFERRLPLRDCILMVSGRASYEIVQKALAAGVSIVCSVSAPSSLAVALAHEFGITLAGFVRGARFNVYAHAQRITELRA